MIDYSPIWISFKCAAFSIFITFFLGLFAARWMMTLKNKVIQLIFDGIFTLPLVLPPTVMGFFLLLIFGVNQPIGSFFLNVFGVRIAFSFSATVIAAVVISFPIMYRSARGALEQVDTDLVDAARTLGMSETSIFFKVLVPNALPGIISGGVLSFARGLGEFGATAMLAGNIVGKTRTLPLAVYSEVVSSDMHSASFYVVVIIAICFTAVILLNIYQLWVKKREAFKMHLEVDIYKKLSEFDLDVHFKIDEICLGVMGPSGSGKSMTLKCIAGIETPDSGRIVLDGRVLYDSNQHINLTPQERNIGYMFQNYALFPNMTVYDNIASPLLARRLDKTTIHDTVIQLMKELHIEGLEKRYPRQLSGGQKQRVALARLLIYNAEAILLDEPFSALDEDLKDELIKEMKTNLEAYHRPVVFVSHNKDEIKTLSHEMDIIKRGEMIHEEIS